MPFRCEQRQLVRFTEADDEQTWNTDSFDSPNFARLGELAGEVADFFELGEAAAECVPAAPSEPVSSGDSVTPTTSQSALISFQGAGAALVSICMNSCQSMV